MSMSRERKEMAARYIAMVIGIMAEVDRVDLKDVYDEVRELADNLRATMPDSTEYIQAVEHLCGVLNMLMTVRDSISHLNRDALNELSDMLNYRGAKN